MAFSIGIFANIWWGASALYWNNLSHLDTLTLLAHRCVWGLPILITIMMWQGSLLPTIKAMRNWRLSGILIITTMLITINWGLFLYASGHGMLVQSALGYFMLPLASVALGMIFLQERANYAQWLAIACAVAGLFNAIWSAGGLSWLAVTLALSFGTYGILRKQISVGPVEGMAMETAILSPPAMAWLLWNGSGFGDGTLIQDSMLLLAGAVTAAPLVGYVLAARGLNMFRLGMLSYVNPTLQFLIGWLVLGETITISQAVTFGCIWLGLIVYSANTFYNSR